MNKFLKILLALSAFVLGFGASTAALADDKVCTTCHDASWDKPILSIYQTKHGVKADPRTPGCQSCHGVSDGHLKNPGTAPDMTFAKKSKNTPEAKNDACLSCHKAGKRAHWDGSQHQGQGLACASCHTVHAVKDRVLSKATQPEVCYTCHKTQRAEFNKISHMPVPEGKMGCSDCHNPHGSTGPKLLVKNTVNETCFTCHADRRGPFLWEHAPVSDDCTNCHSQHGSNNAPLLKSKVPWLCQNCHTGDHASSLKSGSTMLSGNATTVNGKQAPGSVSAQSQTVGRSCLNCHVMIHGSNNPGPGAKFQR